MNHGRSAPLKLEIMASASASVYPSSYINRNYLIKVNGLSPSGDKLNVLVGVSGAIALIGEELFYKFVGRAERVYFYAYFRTTYCRAPRKCAPSRSEMLRMHPFR